MLLEPDVAEAFSDGASVNQALHSYPYLTGQAASQDAAADEPEGAPTKIEARKAGSRERRSLDRRRKTDMTQEFVQRLALGTFYVAWEMR